MVSLLLSSSSTEEGVEGGGVNSSTYVLHSSRILDHIIGNAVTRMEMISKYILETVNESDESSAMRSTFTPASVAMMSL